MRPSLPTGLRHLMWFRYAATCRTCTSTRTTCRGAEHGKGSALMEGALTQFQYLGQPGQERFRVGAPLVIPIGVNHSEIWGPSPPSPLLPLAGQATPRDSRRDRSSRRRPHQYGFTLLPLVNSVSPTQAGRYGHARTPHASGIGRTLELLSGAQGGDVAAVGVMPAVARVLAVRRPR